MPRSRYSLRAFGLRPVRAANSPVVSSRVMSPAWGLPKGQGQTFAERDRHDDGVRTVTDAERRARLAQRHALAPGHAAGSPEAVTRALTVLHSTEPPTPYLSCWARIPSMQVKD